MELVADLAFPRHPSRRDLSKMRVATRLPPSLLSTLSGHGPDDEPSSAFSIFPQWATQLTQTSGKGFAETGAKDMLEEETATLAKTTTEA